LRERRQKVVNLLVYRLRLHDDQCSRHCFHVPWSTNIVPRLGRNDGRDQVLPFLFTNRSKLRLRQRIDGDSQSRVFQRVVERGNHERFAVDAGAQATVIESEMKSRAGGKFILWNAGKLRLRYNGANVASGPVRWLVELNLQPDTLCDQLDEFQNRHRAAVE